MGVVRVMSWLTVALGFSFGARAGTEMKCIEGMFVHAKVISNEKDASVKVSMRAGICMEVKVHLAKIKLNSKPWSNPCPNYRTPRILL